VVDDREVLFTECFLFFSRTQYTELVTVVILSAWCPAGGRSGHKIYPASRS
jgi:hypothetical protein